MPIPVPLWSEAVPPIFAGLAIAYSEIGFPDRSIEGKAEQIKPLLLNPEVNFEVIKDLMKHLAQGWQVTVDLIYTFLAIVAVLVVAVIRDGNIKCGPEFFLIVVLLLANVAIMIWCFVVGPEVVATEGFDLPGRPLLRRRPLRQFIALKPVSTFARTFGLTCSPTFRQLSIYFVLAANAILVAAALLR
jgi:hypothetical protein